MLLILIPLIIICVVIGIIVYLVSSKQNKKTNTLTPEQELRTLKDMLDNGMISIEEYNARREQIINRL